MVAGEDQHVAINVILTHTKTLLMQINPFMSFVDHIRA